MENNYKSKVKVRTSKTTFEKFDSEKITKSLVRETGLDEKKSREVAEAVEKELQGLKLEYVTAPLIREIANVKLLEHGLEDIRAKYTRLGMPVYDVKNLIELPSKENANLQYNPESIHKLLADQVSKEYTLINVLPLELADAHMAGEIHIHDLDYFIRPFCFSHDIRFFLKNGFKADGIGNHTAIAGPAKRPEVAFLHAAKVLAASQTNCFHPDETVLIEEDNLLTTNRIKDVVEKLRKGKTIYCFGFDDNYKIVRQPIIDFNEHLPKGDMLEIILENGKRIRTSEDHPFFYLDNSTLNEKTAREIKVGDYIPIPISLPSGAKIEQLNILEELIKLPDKNIEAIYVHDQNNKILLPKLKNTNNEIDENATINFERSGISIPAKIKITKELMRLLGYYASEGHITWYQKDKNRYDVNLSFGLNEKELIMDAQTCIEKTFGLRVKKNAVHGHCMQLSFGGKLLALIFKSIFMAGGHAKEKTIPWLAFNVDNGLKSEFIKAYFHGDGHIHARKEIVFDTVSEKLASDLSLLFLQLGIITRTRTELTKDREINGRNIKPSFRYRIEIAMGDIERIGGPHLHSHFTRFEKYPMALTVPTNHIGLQELYSEIRPTTPAVLRSCIMQKQRTSRKKAKEFIEIIGSQPLTLEHTEKVDGIRNMLSGDLGFLRVKNINRIKNPERVYDITTPSNSFIGCFGGVLAHNCAGGQGFSFFNTFLAPFITGLDYKKIKQLAQMFIYELSQMYVARGGQVVFSSIDCDMSVPKQFRDIPAILPGGDIKDSVTYADFEDETRNLFNAILDVYLEGDCIGKPFNFPKFEVQIRPDELKNNKNSEELMKVSELAAKFGTPYYIINQPYMPEFACYQCCSFLMPLDEASTEDDVRNGTIRGGGLQVITTNLPQIAYEANGDDDKFFEILRDRMEKAKKTLLLKRETIKRNLNNNLLPFMGQPINDKERYLEVDKQSYIIGLVGMNEAVKAHTGEELHESDNAWKFGLKAMKAMKDTVAQFREETKLNFTLARTPAESSAYRLAQIDLKKYGDKAVVNGENESAYYSNSFHTRPSADIPLWKKLTIEGAFHPLTDGGAMSHVYLSEKNPSPEGIYELTKKIATKTAIQYFAFTKDLSVCSKCNFTSGGLVDECPNCSSKNIDWWSRITGYYQNVAGWNKGKLAELSERRRYGLSNGSQELPSKAKEKLSKDGKAGWNGNLDF